MNIKGILTSQIQQFSLVMQGLKDYMLSFLHGHDITFYWTRFGEWGGSLCWLVYTDHDFISTFIHVIGTYSFDWFGPLYIVHFYMYHMYVLQYILLDWYQMLPWVNVSLLSLIQVHTIYFMYRWDNKIGL